MTPSILNGTDEEWLMYADWLEENGGTMESVAIKEEIKAYSDWSYEWRGVGSAVGGIGVGVGVGGVGVGGVGGVGGVRN